ncbi:MAG: 1-acyl-sn-glycerol-3-phosphate acyltransferase [Bacteroidales bacterium]
MTTDTYQQKQQLIDIDKVLRSKAGGAYRFIPGPLVRYLKRIVHQDEINQALEDYRDLTGLEFIERVLTERFELDIEVVNEENIPSSGRYIVVSNHPLGGLDGMALMHVVGKKRRDVRFLANDILLELHNLKELFVPVNKHGRNTTGFVRALESCFSSDELILIFPAGLVSRRQKGEIRDLEWKKTFISKAIQHKRDIVPVYIDGKNSNFFYKLALWRKRLGIKFNVEMLYLPDEMFRQQNKKLRIIFGNPVPYSTFTKEYSHYQWAQKMKEHVYGLPEGNLFFNDSPQ